VCFRRKPQLSARRMANFKSNDQTTGETESNEVRVKHPLQHEWVLWYDNPEAAKKNKESWLDSLKVVHKFSTVEDFWSLWNNIKPANQLNQQCNYHLFKSGVQPTWEDPVNRPGGKWVLICRNSLRNTRLNDMWQGLVLAIIGNCFEDDEDISGVVVSLRAKGGDKISIWTKTAKNETAQMRIGKQFLQAVEMEKERIGYQAHAEALVGGTNFRNNELYIINEHS